MYLSFKKIIFTNFINYILFFSPKIFKFGKFSIFFLFIPFLFLLSFLLLPRVQFFLTFSTQQGPNIEEQPPMAPQAAPLPPPSPLSPPFLSGKPPWPPSVSSFFLRGMTKMNVHDLPLTIPALNFIQNKI
jgi:hypothetical protein